MGKEGVGAPQKSRESDKESRMLFPKEGKARADLLLVAPLKEVALCLLAL
jgi:hypothetical protein